MHPIIFRIGNFPVAYYGLFIAIGVLLGVVLAARRARRVGVSPDLILDLAFYGVIIGFIGSRVFYIFTDLRGFVEAPLEIIFSRQGYVFFGGLITTLLFAIWFVRRTKSDPWQIADILAPSIPLAHAFGRIGCFMSGCCYGRICPPGWEKIGVQFPRVIDPQTGEMIFSFSVHEQEMKGLIGPDALHSLPVFPVQLFEAGANLILFAVLLAVWRHRSFRGQVFALYIAAYGVIRFALEFFRGDYGDEALFGALQRGQMSQAICLAAVAGGIYIYARRRRTPLEIDAQKSAPAAPHGETEETSSVANAAKRKRRRKH